jgi:hypothetical protein
LQRLEVFERRQVENSGSARAAPGVLRIEYRWGRESANILAMPGQPRFEKEWLDLFAARGVVLVEGTGVASAAYGRRKVEKRS